MKTQYLLLIFTVCTSLITKAQIQFEQVMPLPPAPQNIATFPGIGMGSVTFADIDGDNDQDLLIIGANSFFSTDVITELYKNDGLGNFTIVNETPFIKLYNDAVAFSDIDGDSDQDVLITGYDGNSQSAKLYTNDGSGNYTLGSTQPFTKVSNGSISFADIDGDGDKDVLITGKNVFNDIISELYSNDGLGNFTLITGANISGVVVGSSTFIDVDDDNDPDLLITGQNSSGIPITELYVNDGLGNYTIVSDTPFKNVRYSSIAYTDIDGDNDQDIFVTGQDSSSISIAELYINNGYGNYVLKKSFTGVYYSSVAFGDIDDDNDKDLIITGKTDYGSQITELYKNDGLGNYTTVSETNLKAVYTGSVAFTDVDGDNDQDLFIAGRGLDNYVADLYINDGASHYSIITDTPFKGVYKSSVAYADVDQDGDQDILVTGDENVFTPEIPMSELYINDGLGNYTTSNNSNFIGVHDGSIAFADIDGDGDKDVLITGKEASCASISELYKNDGAGNYTLVTGTNLQGVYRGSAAFADIDGDNDQDLLITGQDFSSEQIFSELYKNDGIGNFTLVSGTPFEPSLYSSIAFADVDNDHDQDVLITSSSISRLYKNDGVGNFTIVNGTSFTGVFYGSIAFADVDNDNDQDVLITGTNSSDVLISELYTNDGSGNYMLTNNPFLGFGYSSVAFADIDNDNDPDILITGNIDSYTSNKSRTMLYINDGLGNYTLKQGMTFDNITMGSVLFTDIDNDNDQDLFITGYSDSSGLVSKLYRNVTPQKPIAIDASGSTTSNKIYPNPVNNELTIENQSEIDEIEVYNITGKLLQTSSTQSAIIKVNFSTYEQGVYLVKVHTKDGKVSTTRVVKD